MSLLAKLWSRRRERPLFVAVAAVVLAALAVFPFFDWWLRTNFEFVNGAYKPGDFGAYMGAVDRWQEGEELYRRTESGGFWGTYLYPPVVVLLFVPFHELLGFEEGAMAWIFVSGTLLWLGLQTLVSQLGYDLRWWERLGLAWLIAGFHPAILTAHLGQTALFMGAMLAFAAAAMVAGGDDRDSRWPLLSGAYTAVVGIVKFAYAPVGAHLLHNPRRMKGALLLVPVVLWISIRFFGIEAHYTYIEVLEWGVNKGSDGARSPTLWLPPYFKPLAWFHAPQLLRAVVCLGVVGLAVLAPPRARNAVFALGVATFPLFTPQTYAYYFVALLPAVVLLLDWELRHDGYPELVLFGLLCVHLHSYGLKFLVHNMPDYFPVWEEWLRPHYLLLQPGLWGTSVLVGLAAVRVGGTVDPGAVAARVSETVDRSTSVVRDVDSSGADGD